MNHGRLRRFCPALFAFSAVATLPLAALSDTATWTGGTGNWTDAGMWSTGAVPGETTDVVIDGDGNTASVVKLEASAFEGYARDVTIDAGDTLAITRIATGNNSSLNFHGTNLVNRGSLLLVSNGPKANNTKASVSFSGSCTNAAGAVISLSGPNNYSGCFFRFEIPVDRSINDGEILVFQPLRTTNVTGIHLSGFGRFVNNGRIELRATRNGSSSGAYLFFPYHATAGACSCIDGVGEIVLDKEEATDIVLGYTRIYGEKFNDTNRSTHTVTNGPQHTIRGTGSLHELTLVNAGLIRAEGTNGVLNIRGSSLNYGGKTMRNLPGGRMVAMAGSELLLGENGSQNCQFINEGLLEARAAGSSPDSRKGAISFATSLTASNNKNTNPTTTPLDLSGTIAGGGTFGGKPLQLTADATLSPGDLENTDGTGASTAGTLTFTTNLVLSAGTTLDFQFGRLETGDYDAVVVDGALTLAGTLRVSALGSATPFGTYRILTCTPGALTGDATSLTIETVGSILRPTLTVDPEAGTVDAFFPPPVTVILFR